MLSLSLATYYARFTNNLTNRLNTYIIIIKTFQLCSGKRYNEDDEVMKKFIKEQIELAKIVQGNMMVTNYFPWVRNVLPKSMFDKWVKLPEAIGIVKEFRGLCEVSISFKRFHNNS